MNHYENFAKNLPPNTAAVAVQKSYPHKIDKVVNFSFASLCH